MGNIINRPIYKKRAGAVNISIFENKGKDKTGKDFAFKSVVLQKSYKDKAGNWQHANISLRSDDIPKAIMLLEKAYEECNIRTD